MQSSRFDDTIDFQENFPKEAVSLVLNLKRNVK